MTRGRIEQPQPALRAERLDEVVRDAIEDDDDVAAIVERNVVEVDEGIGGAVACRVVADAELAALGIARQETVRPLVAVGVISLHEAEVGFLLGQGHRRKPQRPPAAGNDREREQQEQPACQQFAVRLREGVFGAGSRGKGPIVLHDRLSVYLGNPREAIYRSGPFSATIFSGREAGGPPPGSPAAEFGARLRPLPVDGSAGFSSPPAVPRHSRRRFATHSASTFISWLS